MGIKSLIKKQVQNLFDREYNKELETLAQALMEYETLSGEEIREVIAGKSINRADQTPVPAEKQTKASVPEV